jgi:hypothetical protein
VLVRVPALVWVRVPVPVPVLEPVPVPAAPVARPAWGLFARQARRSGPYRKR